MTDIAQLVKEDIEARAVLGEQKYSRRLDTNWYPHNNLDALENLYEELLDACMYIKKALLEREST